MRSYRLLIYREDTLLGHFDTATPGALAAAREIASYLASNSTYRLELLEAYDERRILECSPNGVRLISCEPVFRAATEKINFISELKER